MLRVPGEFSCEWDVLWCVCVYACARACTGCAVCDCGGTAQGRSCVGVCVCVGWGGRGQGPWERGVCPARLAGVSGLRRARRRGVGGAEPLQQILPLSARASSPSGPQGPGPRSLRGRAGTPGARPPPPRGPRTPPAGHRRKRPPAPRGAPGSEEGPRRAGAGAAAGPGGPCQPQLSWAARCGAWSARGPGLALGSAPSAWTAAPRSRAPLAALPQPQRPRRTGGASGQGERREASGARAQSSGTHAPGWESGAGEMQVRASEWWLRPFLGVWMTTPVWWWPAVGSSLLVYRWEKDGNRTGVV